MDKNTALIVACVVFAVVGLMHLLRVIFRTEIVIGVKNVPVWVSVIGLVVAVGLAWWMYAAYAS